MVPASLLLQDDAVCAPASLITPSNARASRRDDRLACLSNLGALDIETPLVNELSGALHAMFDPVTDDVLPIYFGPLLGRLYLAGL